jgi:aspartyl/asparaginyl beta-hydroxylase (cupin superfamily)
MPKAGEAAKLADVSETPIDVRQSVAAGFAALRRADPEAALDAFTRAAATRQADASVWYGMSLVQRKIGTPAEEGAALERALELDPRHLPSLIAKGDWHVRSGDSRAATAFYRAALRLTAGQPHLPAEVRNELQRIEAACQRFAREYEAHVLEAIGRTGLAGAANPRFGHALDLLLGKREIYLQQPKYFFFPELPQVQFYDRRQFPWAAALERKTAAIRAELQALLAAGGGIEPYVQRSSDRPVANAHGLMNNLDWSAAYLIRSGMPEQQNAARCPQTMAALREVPLCEIEGRTPSVLFSLLRPGAHIAPHNGYTNVRLICHLPLIVPGHCTLRVGNETRSWREGELMIFDDSIEHEASNGSSELRAILLFDVWRPEVTADERTLVSALLKSVDAFGPQRQWTD